MSSFFLPLLEPGLAACIDLAGSPLLAADAEGRVLQANRPMRVLLAKLLHQPALLNGEGELPPFQRWPLPVAALVGWPGDMAAAGATADHQGWVSVSGSEPRHYKASVRGLRAMGRAEACWLVQIQAVDPLQTRAILDSALVGIVTLGEHGIEWMNRSARRMFGGELPDFLGQPMSIVASAEPDHPLRRTDWWGSLQQGQAETFECRLMALDGRSFWVVGNVVATTREAGGGQLTFALLDIERRRKAETQIAQARASLQRMIETAPLAIALFDAATHRVLQLNQMMVAFAGRPVAEILARRPEAWLPEPYASTLEAGLLRAQRSGEPYRSELHREPDAQLAEPLRVWDVRIVSLADAAGAGEQLLMVASDVTEQRAADEARLESAIVQREMLIKEVHHRIKNNLQGVAGLLQQNAARYPEASAAIAEAVGQVHAIAQVHGLQVGMSGPLLVQGVMEAVAQTVQRMFGRRIDVQTLGEGAECFALNESDSIPVALTLNELLTNAVKHSAQGPVRCQLRREEGAAGESISLTVASLGQLPPGFSLAAVPSGISGLGLVRALLPRKGAQITLEQQGAEVVARLQLAAPALATTSDRIRG